MSEHHPPHNGRWGAAPHGSDAGVTPAGATSRRRAKPAHPARRLAMSSGAASAALFVLASFALFEPGGVLADPVVIWSAVAAVVAAAATSSALRAAPHASRRARRLSAAVPIVLASLLGFGWLNQTTLDGDPVLRGSRTDRDVSDVRGLRGALDELVEADKLLSLPLDQARVRAAEFRARSADLERIVEKWGGRKVDSFGNVELSDAARAAVQAADLAIAALAATQDNVARYDDARAVQISELRTSFVSEALRAGELLRTGADAAGVASVLDAPVRE